MSRLSATGVTKAYPGLSVLAGLDLQVEAGEVVAVRGASGTGKSTLLHILGLLDRADAGEIRLDGQVVSGLDQSATAQVRATSIGFVFQAFHLLPEFTVLENIVMAARAARLPLGAAQVRAQGLLAAVGLAGRENSAVTTLSGGERQRVALARALLNKPALLLADEPTGNLDPVTATLVLDKILGLAREDRAGVVLVTHDPAIAARADRRLELRGGALHPG